MADSVADVLAEQAAHVWVIDLWTVHSTQNPLLLFMESRERKPNITVLK